MWNVKYLPYYFVLFFVLSIFSTIKSSYPITISLTQGLSELGQFRVDPELQIGRVTLSISKPLMISAAELIVDTSPFPIKRVEVLNPSFSVENDLVDHQATLRLQRVNSEFDQSNILSLIIDTSSGFPVPYGAFHIKKAMLIENDKSPIENVEIKPGSWFFPSDILEFVPVIVLRNKKPIVNAQVVVNGLIGAPGIIAFEERTNEEGQIKLFYPLSAVPNEALPPVQVRIQVRNPNTLEDDVYLHDAIHTLRYDQESNQFESISIDIDVKSRNTNWETYR